MSATTPLVILASAVYTAAEAALPLRCSTKTVEQWLRDGALAGIKPGGEWIIPGSALLRRLDELAIEQAAARRQPTGPAPALPAQTVAPPAASTQRATKAGRGARQPRTLPALVDLRNGVGAA